jgi:hypothetical protein
MKHTLGFWEPSVKGGSKVGRNLFGRGKGIKDERQEVCLYRACGVFSVI